MDYRQKVISDIVESLNENFNNIEPVVGHGSVNQIFIVSTNKEKLVIRLNDNRGYDEFVKEKWCIEKAEAKGVLSPKVLKMGEMDGYSYMAQSFLNGVVGSQGKLDTVVVWKEIGRYAKLIHNVPVSGFGLDSSELMSSSRNTSNEKWKKFVAYNIQSLNSEDKLLDLGTLDEEQSRRVKKLFQELIQKQFQFGLNHGDISLKNVIVSNGNRVSIFDWGSAEAEIVPHHDIGVILEDSLKANSPEFKAFLEGYGLSDADYHGMEEDLHSLMLLRAIDKLRWAIDKHEEDIPAFTERVKKFYQMKFK